VTRWCGACDLSQRVRSFLDELLLLRGRHVPDHCADLHAAFTRTLAVAQLKFAWVGDLIALRDRHTNDEYVDLHAAVTRM